MRLKSRNEALVGALAFCRGYFGLIPQLQAAVLLKFFSRNHTPRKFAAVAVLMERGAEGPSYVTPLQSRCINTLPEAFLRVLSLAQSGPTLMTGISPAAWVGQIAIVSVQGPAGFRPLGNHHGS